MYLWGVKSPSNLGGLGRLGRLGYRPNQAAQRIFSRRRRGLRGLGQDETDAYSFPIAAPPTYDTTDVPISTSLLPPPSSPTPIGPNAAQAWNILTTSATPVSNPLDYVSPAAAIQAGLPAAQVNTAWANQAQANNAAAAAAGISNAAASIAKVFTSGSPGSGYVSQTAAAPVNTSSLLLIGAGVFLIAMLAGGKK
jgi:hypothetical protein